MSAARKTISDGELIVTGVPGVELIRLIINEKRRHLCQEDGFQCAEEIKIAQRISESVNLDWKNPINNLFVNHQLIVETYEIGKNTEKKHLLQQVENFFTANKVKQTLLQDICLAVEETVSNVLMHAAPYLRVEKIGQLQVAIDPANFKAGFICQDYAGKMNIDRMLEKIYKCYAEGVGNSISMTTRGAGIGTEGAGSYFLFNKSGVSSFVGASYPVMSDKKRLAFSKHFHIGNE